MIPKRIINQSKLSKSNSIEGDSQISDINDDDLKNIESIKPTDYLNEIDIKMINSK